MFTKDSRQENFLNRHGVSWEYSNGVSFDQLAPAWNIANYGRSKAKVEAAIDEYARRTKAGSEAPAPILRRTVKGFEPLDGVQRLLVAEREGATTFSAYLIETDSDLLAMKMRVLANAALGGHPEPPEWSRQQAIQKLIIEGGMSIAEVATAGGWSKKAVEDDKTVMDYGFAIRTIGGPEKLNKGILLQISKIANLDDWEVARGPIAAFCNDLKRGKFSNGDAEPHISTFFGGINRKNRKQLHDQYARQYERFCADPEVQTRMEGRERSHLKPATNLLRQIRGVRTITKKLIMEGKALRYMDEFFQAWNQVERDLKTIAQLGKKTKVSP